MPAKKKIETTKPSRSDAPTCSLSSSADTPIMNAAMGWHDRRDLLAQIGLLERDVAAWKANHDNQVALKRIIASRADLKERAPMVEKLMAERNRAQAHSIRQHEEIKRLQAMIATETKPAIEVLRELLERVKSGAETPEQVAEYRHIAGEISAWGQVVADGIRRRNARCGRRQSSENAEAIRPATTPQ